MSYAKNPEIIFQQMNYKKLRYWQVFDTDKSSLIAESSDDDSLTINDSIQELNDVLNALEGIVYVVVRSDTATKKRKATSEGHTQIADKYAGIYKYMLKMGEAANRPESGGAGAGSFANTNLFGMLLKMQEEKAADQLKFLTEKHQLETSFNKKLEEIEKKLNGKKNSDHNPEMDKRIMQVLDKLLGN